MSLDSSRSSGSKSLPEVASSWSNSPHSSATTPESYVPASCPYSYSECKENVIIVWSNGAFVEEIERYETGGLHPVHVGDVFDQGRYRIVNKLDEGGFATVWLAADEREKSWVALKIVEANHSPSMISKSELSRSLLDGISTVASYHRSFTFDGPTVVTYVLEVARRATQAVADLHLRGLCHGDVTTGTLLLGVSGLDGKDSSERLLGLPERGALMTEPGVNFGSEVPQYVVNGIDFLSLPTNLLKPDVNLLDFDQCFAASSPPHKMPGTPLEFLAPEVAVGMAASPASDVWALGCCIFRMRSGSGPFSSPFEIGSPYHQANVIVHTLGDMPRAWSDGLLWGEEEQPTRDVSKGLPPEQWWTRPARSLRELVFDIWDEPQGRAVETGGPKSPEHFPPTMFSTRQYQPFAEHFSHMVWNPRAVKVDGAHLDGYGGDWEQQFTALPKISEEESVLLYDLLSKMFVFEPEERITAKEMLDHPWFRFNETKMVK